MSNKGGYTGRNPKYEPAGTVHRGHFINRCSCGGFVEAYWDGELISHTLPFDAVGWHHSGGVEIRPNVIESEVLDD